MATAIAATVSLGAAVQPDAVPGRTLNDLAGMIEGVAHKVIGVALEPGVLPRDLVQILFKSCFVHFLTNDVFFRSHRLIGGLA